MPSPKVRTISDYLAEAEAKLNLMGKITSNPVPYFGAGSSVYIPEGRLVDQFIERFETLPLTTIEIKNENVARALAKEGLAGVLASFGASGIEGSTLNVEGMCIPYVNKEHSKGRQGISIHESVHAIRRQWQPFIPHKLYLHFEEILAYSTNESIETAHKILSVPGSITYSFLQALTSSLPVIAVGGVLGGMDIAKDYGTSQGVSGGIMVGVVILGMSSAIGIGLTMPGIIRYNSLARKAKEEGFNIDYLALRTNPSEFSLNKTLEEQLASKQGVRWDILRDKYGIAKAGPEC